MIYSMTGFGRAVCSTHDSNIIVEIKSLNSKQLDLAMRLPQSLKKMEVMLRPDVAKNLIRGKVEVSVTVENISEDTPSKINIPALKGYKAQVEKLGEELSLQAPQDWYSVLLRMPDAFKTTLAQENESEEAGLRQALDEAMQRLTAFRAVEGEKLERFFREKIKNIASLLSDTDPFEAERVPRMRRKIIEQLSRLETEYDRDRLEQEMIFYIEKLDVTEEKTRLKSHMDYFLETLSLAIPGQGKKLGFIAQEMGREINTLGSKSNDAEMQKIVVRMKDELEQIKEQVLNVL